MTLQIPTAQIKSVFNAALSNAAGAEAHLGAQAQAQVQALVDELYPLVVSETQALLSATNPAIPQAYLGILEGCVSAAIAKLGLDALSQQRQLLASALQSGIQILALVLRAAVIA